MRLPATPITPTIVFDLDGTLVHTVPDIAAALDIALAPYKVTPTSGAEAATMMGDGLSEFFWRALVAKRINLPALEADAARQRFIEVYSQSPARLSEVYPGIRELLKDLRDRGVLTAVCTNKIEAIALDILERLELRGLFDAVVGQRDDRPMKPDPRPLLEAVARAGGRIERTLLVGDTGADNGAAIAARIPVILLDYGYSHLPISALTYGIIVDNAQSLRAAVMGFVGNDQMPGPDTDLPHHWAA
jgi:phosphoglycolate phosphatase